LAHQKSQTCKYNLISIINRILTARFHAADPLIYRLTANDIYLLIKKDKIKDHRKCP